ncbi:GntR family transcriptional regulator [Aestuariivita boseongensis]|uniref:GntR family transcriptional regulator n=1 Tax=Aestuariivita boseongensis TaxID=1470562 RepID=UPI000AB5E485|nr:GntR family transcriptional regulator [Aestuariivita boseongensis]
MGQISYRQIKEDVRSKVVRGVWALGAELPKEEDMAADYGCARATVNRALRELAEEGLLERKRKSGTRVRQAPVRQARFDIPLVRREIESLGERYTYRLLEREETQAPAWLCARMRLTRPDPVLHLRCLHVAGDTHYQVEDRWINLTTIPAAREADFTTQGPNEWLIATIPFSDVEIGFSATAADADLARDLGCALGDPLFQGERSTWLNDAPVTYVRMVFGRGYKMTTRY